MAKQLKKTNIEVLKAWIRKNGAWNNSHTVYVCGTCKKSFSKSPSAKSKFCSQVCEYKAMKLRRGNIAPNWKGGKPKCLDCQKEVSYTSKRCKSCAAKLM